MATAARPPVQGDDKVDLVDGGVLVVVLVVVIVIVVVILQVVHVLVIVVAEFVVVVGDDAAVEVAVVIETVDCIGAVIEVIFDEQLVLGIHVLAPQPRTWPTKPQSWQMGRGGQNPGAQTLAPTTSHPGGCAKVGPWN